MDALFSFCHSNKKTIPETLPFPTKKKKLVTKNLVPPTPPTKNGQKSVGQVFSFHFSKVEKI